MDQSLVRVLQDETFVFDCRRVVYWPRKKILIAADLHWGKTQYLRNHGVAISDKVFEGDLVRLSQVMDDYETETLLVLGDLILHEEALSKGIVDKIAHFRNHNPCELVLVKGNHDRYADFPESWGIVEEGDLRIDDFYFAHEHSSRVPLFQFSGHVHPMVKLSSGFETLRLPSFILGEFHCYLPAFSHLTGGQDVKLKKGQEALVLTSDGVESFQKPK